MLETKFGPFARDGDYVIVVDFNYMRRTCNTYTALVYHGKAYTGIINHNANQYIHKLKAECVIPANYVDEDKKKKILQDIATHCGPEAIYNLKNMERGVVWEK